MQVKRSSVLPFSGQAISDELSVLPTPELVRLAQLGKAEAFDPLYRRYADRLFAYTLCRMSGNHADAEDLASQAWAVALASIDTFTERGRDGDEFCGWLFGIARRRSMRTFDRRWREYPYGGTGEDIRTWVDRRPAVHGGDDASDDDAVECRDLPQLRERLLAAVDGLPVAQRTVVRMRLDGAEDADIAVVLGCTVATVGRAWRHAQELLRDRLSERAVSEADLFASPEGLADALAALPAAQREVAEMRLAGMRAWEIAEATGKSRCNVSATWTRAQRALRERLTQRANMPAGRDAVQAAQLDKLRNAAKSLPPVQQQVALMRLNGMRRCDIVRATGRSTSAVNDAWRRAQMAFTRRGLATTTP